MAEITCVDCHSHVKIFVGIAALLVGSAAVGYFVGITLTKRRQRINTSVKLSTDKVVDTIDLEDIGDQKVFCRCWKSEKFPYCDGSHNKHNKCHDDNVGPLIVRKAEDSKIQLSGGQ